MESIPELVQTEERFADIRDALKTLNKMDFDKLIASVPQISFNRVVLDLMAIRPTACSL
jgi:hypothetical protein